MRLKPEVHPPAATPSVTPFVYYFLRMLVNPQPAPDARFLHLVKPLAFFDLEATGTTVGLDRIVEIGVLKVTPGGEELQLQTRINPEIRIPKEATAVHGISDEDVEDLAENAPCATIIESPR